jgi:hypothetical protein
MKAQSRNYKPQLMFRGNVGQLRQIMGPDRATVHGFSAQVPENLREQFGSYISHLNKADFMHSNAR